MTEFENTVLTHLRVIAGELTVIAICAIISTITIMIYVAKHT